MCILVSIKTQILPQHGSTPPLMMRTMLSMTLFRIQCATSLAIFITPPLRLLLALSPMVVLRWSLLPQGLPVLMHRSHPHLPHVVFTEVSQLYRRALAPSPFIRLSVLLLFVVTRYLTPLLTHLYLLVLFHPPYPLPLPSSTTQTPWRLPIHLTSHLRLPLIKFLTI